MNSYEKFVITIVDGVIDDAILRWPSLESSLERDRTRLRRALEDRGLSFFTITLPEAGKSLDKRLDGLEPSDYGFPQGYPLKDKQPLLFGGLLALVFDSQGYVLDDACTEAVFFIRQLHFGFKKLNLACKPERLEETLYEFFQIEQELPPSHIGTWEEDCPEWEPRYGHPLHGEDVPTLPLDKEQINYSFDPNSIHFWSGFRALCVRITGQMGEPDWYNLIPRHGPGAVSESGVRKYSFPNWPRKLGLWFPFEWFGSASLDVETYPSELEPASRLIAVPKTQKGPRLICAEPIAHQYLQQALWRWMEEAIRGTSLSNSINFRRQDLSQDRVLKASRDSKESTIDLSSASDRVSTRLVEYVFQTHPILDGLHHCRTRYLGQELSTKFPRLTRLRKFSTMGSAMTFPVQSVVFAIICIYSLIWMDRKDPTKLSRSELDSYASQVRVFGDDLIIPTRSVATISLLLEECGLKVNTSKSFGGANFRESCGMDAFKGVDVTPAYFHSPYDGSANSLANTIDTSNNLFYKGLWKTSDCVCSQVPIKELKMIPVLDHQDLISDDLNTGVGGLRLISFTGTLLPNNKWDTDYQRYYSDVISVTNRVTKEKGEGQESLLQYFVEKPRQDIVWSSGEARISRPRKGRGRVYR